jgi:hypothetical protein
MDQPQLMWKKLYAIDAMTSEDEYRSESDMGAKMLFASRDTSN